GISTRATVWAGLTVVEIGPVISPVASASRRRSAIAVRTRGASTFDAFTITTAGIWEPGKAPSIFEYASTTGMLFDMSAGPGIFVCRPTTGRASTTRAQVAAIVDTHGWRSTGRRTAFHRRERSLS